MGMPDGTALLRMSMAFQKPRLIIAALRGGSGKTLVSLGLTAAWRLHRGLSIVPFKKGPDYIDAGWLSLAAQSPCYNLDPFLMTSDAMLRSFVYRSSLGVGSVVEGNRGLYDGVDAQGSYSTAELAKLLRSPVVLVLDGTKVTRTAAALVLGCLHLDPEVHIAGVILNHVAGARHERVLRGAIEESCGVPVLGVIPKVAGNVFPERHLGLVPPQESTDALRSVELVAEKMCGWVDLDRLWRVAQTAGVLGIPLPEGEGECRIGNEDPVVIGVIRDSAFQFYYPENLEALCRNGAQVKEISSFEQKPLPAVDALYIGGGFPETHLEILAGNAIFKSSLRERIEAGLPVYAECGGLMFLCSGIVHRRERYPMVGVFPFEVVLEKKPQGHGYTVLECVNDNPFYPEGTCLKGHEFHYSRVVGYRGDYPFAFKMSKGHGIVEGWDGMCYKKVLAGYSHVHAVGNELWAKAMVRAAEGFRQQRRAITMFSDVEAEGGVIGTPRYLTVQFRGDFVHGNR